MSCPNYYFKNSDYYCLKREEYVSSDTYYKYCRNYDYDDCPVYKEEGSGGCYISTACVYALGCEDDCHELNILRKFRDNYVKQQPEGVFDINEYYKYAPQIVKKVNTSIDKKKIYKQIFSTYIKPCLDLIKAGSYNEAYKLYKVMYNTLKKEYLNNI